LHSEKSQRYNWFTLLFRPGEIFAITINPCDYGLLILNLHYLSIFFCKSKEKLLLLIKQQQHAFALQLSEAGQLSFKMKIVFKFVMFCTCVQYVDNRLLASLSFLCLCVHVIQKSFKNHFQIGEGGVCTTNMVQLCSSNINIESVNVNWRKETMLNVNSTPGWPNLFFRSNFHTKTTEKKFLASLDKLFVFNDTTKCI
jgi:hypothetical protein